LAEQQITVNKQGYDGNAAFDSSRSIAHLNDMTWDLNAMLQRFNLVSEFDWQLSDAVGDVLPIVATNPVTNVPYDMLRNAIVSTPFTRFNYFICKSVSVRFQLVASRFHQGRLAVGFTPAMVYDNQYLRYANLTRITQVQHATLDPSDGTVIIFDIPFVHYKGFLDLTSSDTLGVFSVVVMDKLQAATGASNSVQVKVFISFNEPEFRVPIPSGTTFVEMQDLVRPITRIQPQMGLLSGVGQELDNLVESIIPKEITGAIAGICLDKPAVTEYPPPLTVKDAQYMSSNRGVENLERMTLEPSAQYITTTQFGSDVDECDIKYLVGKPNFLRTVNWKATDSAGTILWSTYVDPIHLLTNAPSTAVPFVPTTLGGIASLFTFWRGGIKIVAQVAGTPFHEGRLDFCFHPNMEVVPADYSAAMSQYVTSHTVRNTNNTIEVVLPYLSDTPWKRVWTGIPPGTAGSRFMDYVVGTFSLRVSVPLKNPSNVAQNVDINIYVAGADDFEVHLLSPNNPSLNWLVFPTATGFEREDSIELVPEPVRSSQLKVVKPNLVRSKPVRIRPEDGPEDDTPIVITPQMGDVNTDSKDDSGTTALAVSRAINSDISPNHFGESYRNLRECAKRYQLLTSLGYEEITAASVAVSWKVRELPGFIGLLMSMFRLFRGPLCYKLRLFSANNADGTTRDATGFVTFFPYDSGSLGNPSGFQYLSNWSFKNPSGVASLCAPVRFSTTQVAEYLVPFSTHFHSLLTQSTNVPNYFDLAAKPEYSACFTQEQLMVVDLPNHVMADVYFNLSVAFGDETRLGCFVGLPECVLNGGDFYPTIDPSLTYGMAQLNVAPPTA
jgi:hypothetical protein